MKDSLILVVDDNLTSLSIIKTILEKSGYTFISATNGREAIETTIVAQPDLVLLDVGMPDIDGFETCKRLKADERTQDIPVIFLTAYSEITSMVKGFEAGAIDYITKPFNSTELRTRIETHLELLNKRETIRKRNYEKRELIHVLCHDLATPLLHLQTVMEMYEDNPAMMIELLGPMKASIRNGLELIDLIKNIEFFEEDKIELLLTRENLSSVTTEAVAMFEQKLDSKNMRVEMAIDKNHHVIIERVSFINSILNNLLTNAIKFSFSGSHIEIRSKEAGDKIQLSIRDSGIGMPPKMVDDIFDIRKTSSRPGTENEEGTGFGMPLVKKIIHAYNGGINVISSEKSENAKNHGTEVILSLQAAE